jgi:hypothetical protein
MTTARAIKLLEQEAERLRGEGHYAAAHDWQRRANEMRHLVALAVGLSRGGALGRQARESR